MNEYNFNFEEINNNEETNTTPQMNNFNSPEPQKPKKKHIGLKIAASLMAMTIVSAGSIEVYRMIDKNSANGIYAVSESESADPESSIPESTVSAETVSMIRTSSSDDAVLTTEQIVEKVMPSVVGIESTFKAPEANNNYNNFNDFFGFGFNFGDQQQQVQQNPVGTGTGVIITEDGYIVTNAHVIYDSQDGYGLAETIEVVHGDDRYDAEVIGYDVESDLAVLKVDANGLTAAEFGDSDNLKLGEDVTAIGNPLGFDLMNTVTRGIVSGLNRNITINDKSMSLIQTDAAINAGNSGGPLINKYGQVIGINSAKMSSSYYSSEASIEGICFAIPSNFTATVVNDLRTYGIVKGKPQLGISCQDVTESIAQMYNMPVGIYVVEINEGSAAAKSGLQKGDIITAVDGVKVTTSTELTAQKNLHKAGEEIELTLVRSGEEMTVKVTLDEKTTDD